LTNSFAIADDALAFEETSTRREMRSGGEKRREREAGDEEPRFMIFCFAFVFVFVREKKKKMKARARALF
jgi:hypothetical protein